MSRRASSLAGYLLLFIGLGVSAHGTEPDLDANLVAYFEIWSSGELARLDTLVAEDFKRHGGPDESCGSRDELKAMIEQTRQIYKHVRISVEDMMTEVGGGAMRGSFYGVHRDIERIVEFPLMSMVRFAAGDLRFFRSKRCTES